MNYPCYLDQLAMETELGFDEFLHGQVIAERATVLCLEVVMDIKKHGPYLQSLVRG